ncbi:MAG: DUF1949 domain-containing protein [Clostridia bacterium]|nr:DUF1949 domain-containing protein [Clostridia bacterium]
MLCDYAFYGRLASLIPENGGIIEDSVFEDNVRVIFRIKKDDAPSILAKIIDASNGRFEAKITDEFYADVD